jgi:hypothetical protein
VAGLGAFFSARIASELSTQLAGQPAALRAHEGQLSDAVSSGAIHQVLASVPQQFQGTVQKAADASFISGFNEILLIAGAVALVGSILGFLMVRKRDFVGAPQPQEPAEAPQGAEPIPAA